MTNQEILIKAIKKAIDNGWDIGDDRPVVDVSIYDGTHEDFDRSWSADVWFYDNDFPTDQIPKGKYRNLTLPFQHPIELIFNHDFAKALWGEFDRTCSVCGKDVDDNCHEDSAIIKAYEYYLQQMVVAEDSIAYLGEHI